MGWVHVPGADKGHVALYAISTCPWCKKAKASLNRLGIAYDYVDMDLLPEEEKKARLKEVVRWKKRAIYPLVVIDDRISIPIYNEKKIKEALHL